jgi:hypothetical protein
MSQRSVQLDIKVSGEDQINDLNKSLEKTGVDAEKVADQTLKLSKGIAGSFELAAQAAGVFGEDTSKAFEATIKRATEYIALSNALKDVAEGFSKENIKGLTAIFQGFTKAGVGAQLFGNISRIAITSTGIGALVVGLGLLIANWEAVSKAVLEFVDSIPFLKAVKDTVTELVEKVGSLGNLFKAVGAFIGAAFTSGKNAVDEFNKSLEKGNLIAKLTKEGEAIAKQNEGRAESIKLLEAQGKQEEKILGIQKEIAKSTLDNLQARKTAGEELSKEDEKRITALELELKLIDIKTAKVQEAARKEAYFKENAEIQSRLKLQEELDAVNKKAEEDRLKDFNETNKKIVESWKETNTELKEITVDNEKEAYDEVEAISKERTAAILDIQEKIRVKKTEEFNEKKLEEEIEFLEAKRELTEEEEEILLELKAEKRAQDFESINEYAQLAGETINNISQVITDSIQRNIDGIQLQIQGINTQFQESVANREALEAELADAQGARRVQILTDIDKEKAKEKSLGAERKRLQNEQIKAQNQINEVNYANAVIQSIIGTAQAVIAALSTVPPASFVLAAISAALAAVQTGIVIANKPKPIPLLAAGGFTPDGVGAPDSTGERPVAAQLHENEWVAPRWMVQSDRFGGMINELEQARTGKKNFAVGGFSTPNIADSGTSAGTDTLIAALQGLNLAVAVTEINTVQSRVNVIETKASL